MRQPLRRAGLPGLDGIPWGTHICHLYETEQDLSEVIVPYLQAGLESNEYCI
ncbi:MAG: MEDS domain-containing protein [Bacillota bacterium]|nr:MEDS domain-containing protein [Bacillota bacterium]